MRTFSCGVPLAVLVLGGSLDVQAHIGSPNVFVERQAGPYLVRAIVRPPDVVPGLAEITVGVEGRPVQRVTVLPVFWNAGHAGAPRPDEANPVRGETNLFTASLWLMKSGAYSVDVSIEGAGGKVTVVVPVNAVATNTRPMSRGYAIMLSALGLVLFLGAVEIAGAAFGESRLDPAARMSRKDRWRGYGARVVAAGVLGLMIFGGKKWWDFEHNDYRKHSLYKPVQMSAHVIEEQTQPVLKLEVDAPQGRRLWAPMPDHGKLMHLFLVRDGKPGAFAHLHPLRRGRAEFAAPLPPLPAGNYHLYAEVTHEDGFAETLAARADLPAASLAMRRLWFGESDEPICSVAVAQMLATNLVLRPDPDDSWHLDRTGGSRGTIAAGSGAPSQMVADAGGGYKLIWENPAQPVKQFGSLRFKLTRPDGQIAMIEPYMGMRGHAVVRREDGAVFAHIHPEGSFSMAAEEFFLEPDRSARKENQRHELNSPPPAGQAEPVAHEAHARNVRTPGQIAFPYLFPQPGRYRLWVQMRSEGRIFTGVFDPTIAGGK